MAAYQERNQNVKRNTRIQNQAYIDGNTVRKPAYRPETAPDTGRETVREPKRELNRRPLVGFRREMDFFTLGIICIAIAMIAFCGMRYLRVKGQVTELDKALTKLNKEYKTIQGENNDLLYAIADDINLNEVYEIAVGKLGMVYPNENMVVEFECVGGGCVRQYADVPEAADEGEVDAVTEVLRRLMK
ncbi:MAG: hypothetical protein J6P36_04595 [Lachnospiraceae bacterium]|nr:hypothetical protein [Lachnospiraceae bacterium]